MPPPIPEWRIHSEWPGVPTRRTDPWKNYMGEAGIYTLSDGTGTVYNFKAFRGPKVFLCDTFTLTYQAQIAYWEKIATCHFSSTAARPFPAGATVTSAG